MVSMVAPLPGRAYLTSFAVRCFNHVEVVVCEYHCEHCGHDEFADKDGFKRYL